MAVEGVWGELVSRDEIPCSQRKYREVVRGDCSAKLEAGSRPGTVGR
jgi:hypothetical protein